jgi:6-phosphogluconolactonase
VLLGLGSDGHTASLFPGSASLQVHGRWVVADYVRAVSMWRVSLTAIVINAAAAVAFVVSGDAKAAIVRQVLEGPAQPYELPAQLIAPAEGHLLWFLDTPAAADLRHMYR